MENVPVAWLNLLHNQSRFLAAIAGVGCSVTLVFVNLGTLGAMENAALAFYRQLNTDVYLLSAKSKDPTVPTVFSIRHLSRLEGLAEVKRVMPLYSGQTQWKNAVTGNGRQIQVYGFDLKRAAFFRELSPEVITRLQPPDTVLFDRRSHREYGPREVGIVSKLGEKTVEIIGLFSLGNSFEYDGTILLSDQNFQRLFLHSLNLVSEGLIQLEEGVDADRFVRDLNQTLSPDVIALTRQEIMEREKNYWLYESAFGTIFQAGAAIALIVGVAILYQVLSNDITSHLPEYAFLKAMGYHKRYILFVVLQEATILACLGYIPGFFMSWGFYQVIFLATGLPFYMEVQRAIFIFCLTIVMCLTSGAIVVNKATRLDPADVLSSS
ncbi:MAG: FtsX-like permease family protein [Cyanobacteria bacterium SBLK]|nr:FtsX-like permease family protein [Cyanobacteria bacterium SBLK]